MSQNCHYIKNEHTLFFSKWIKLLPLETTKCPRIHWRMLCNRQSPLTLCAVVSRFPVAGFHGEDNAPHGLPAASARRKHFFPSESISQALILISLRFKQTKKQSKTQTKNPTQTPQNKQTPEKKQTPTKTNKQNKPQNPKAED